MPIALADRMAAVKPSATIAVSMKAAEMRAAGRDIVSLSAGEPDFDAPEHVLDAARTALATGDTHYTAVDGTPALKAAIARKYARDDGLEFSAEQIIVSNGAKHSIFNYLAATLNPGDEVLVPAPYWVSYPDMVRLLGGRPVIIDTSPETSFRVTPEQLRAAISPRTRLLILNAPSNPTGQVYPAPALEALAEVLREHPAVAILSDDIYEHIYWGREPLRTLPAVAPDLAERTILVNGVSKGYAMTGFRIGYAAGPTAVVAAMRKVQGQSTSCPGSVSQAAAAAALDGPWQPIEAMCIAFHERHDRLVEGLNRIDGFECLPADGAFYAFPAVTGLLARRPALDDDVALAGALLEEVGVATVPGTAFGRPGHLRLSYATDLATLDEALARLGRYAAAP